MKRHSSGEKNKEFHHQSTCSKNRKKQSATPPRPPSYSQSLPRKLHLQSKPSCTARGNPTTTECGPSQKPTTLHETLLARKHQHQQPSASTSAPFGRRRNGCNTGRHMYSETLRPQKQHRRNVNNQLPHDVEIHQDALNNLTRLHEQRICMLTKMQSSQNKLNTHFKTRLHHNSEQLEEAKQRQRDQEKRICDLRELVDHLEHNLMQHVESIESLKELITRATTGSSSSDDDQNQGRNNIETERAQTEEEGTSPTSSDDGTDDGDDEDVPSEEEEQRQTHPTECPIQMRAEHMAKDKRATKIYGAPNTIRYLNQTLTGRTIDSFGTRRSSESSGYTTDPGDAGGLHEIEALAAEVASAMSDDETLLGPVIPARSVSGREACPYCQKDLSKSYINQHIKKHCPKSPDLAPINEDVSMPNRQMVGRRKV